MFFIFMVAPLIGVLAGHALRFGITSSSLKAGAGTFAQALPFGAGYSFGTYVGFPKNYESNKKYNKAKTYNLRSNMSYNRQKKWFSTRRTSWYTKPLYHRKMRRMVYVHPRGNRYGY